MVTLVFRNENSVESGGAVASNCQMPEAHSLVATLLLSDTFLDLHRDVNFDSCPVCACTTSIAGTELGVYVRAPPNFDHGLQQINPRCNCGFR